MHTVKWVSQQLGLAPGTLRAWEQRYGVVHPTRSEGGFRLYSDADVATLRAMSGLVVEGMQPAQAAAQLRSASVTSPEPRPGESFSGLPGPSALIAAARAYDAAALEGALDTAFSAAAFEHVIDVWLVDAMAAVGAEWAADRLDVAQEHFISAGVMRRVTAAYHAAGGGRRFGPHVLTGLAPGASHEIATLAFATMLRRAGVRVTYLGPDLPLESWGHAVHAIRPDAVVIGAPRARDASAATEVAESLRAAAPRTAVYVGGPGASPEQALTGGTLAGAAALLAQALGGG